MVFRKNNKLSSINQRKSTNRSLPGSFGRLQYLQNLIGEYQQTSVAEHKEQILANLANFCYDSRNGPQLRQLRIIDLFFDCILEPSSAWFKAAFQSGSNLKVDVGEARLAEFALGGLSNLSASSPLSRQEILNHIHLPCIVACATSPDSTVVVHSLTIIVHLFTRCPNSEDFISLGSRFPAIIQIARQYLHSYCQLPLAVLPEIRKRNSNEKLLSTCSQPKSDKLDLNSQSEPPPYQLPGSSADQNTSAVDIECENHSYTSEKSHLFGSTSVNKWAPNPLVTSSSTSCPTTIDLVLTQPPAVLLFKHYASIAAGLSKARLTGLVVSTALVGCGLAASTSMVSPEFLENCYSTVICLALGTTLTSSAANTINQIIEIPYDSQMTRTRNRVLVRGLTTPGRAALFAMACTGSGLSLLYFGVNPLVTSLAAVNMLLYTCIYTPLKQISQVNTWVGAWVGAIPPLMGWAAATGQLQCGSIILACLLYVWQFPHFMALSWNMRSEYSKAGYAMTSIINPDLCKRVALRYSIASSLVCLAGAGCSAISLGPWAGCALGIGSLPANIGLIYYAWKFAKSNSNVGDGSSAAARRLFRATLFHLPVVMITVLLGSYCSINAGHM
ncbi:putative protoheme IX farnesyltransferase [Schistosoma mansoni]|uniref:putative protoheme IX farnesyltransferase n=1 Tax=Schistosoma mansoni TaxID=6183 RepID=UPI00022DC705|nr:putative protoheme IX farnesyltransferase [Schistosoma mansoni]|eukprot:XP_018652628.1 putative protoheme IX farnesyltransferase [Schistosoma mansoni]